jgi:hypothetical protein
LRFTSRNHFPIEITLTFRNQFKTTSENDSNRTLYNFENVDWEKFQTTMHHLCEQQSACENNESNDTGNSVEETQTIIENQNNDIIEIFNKTTNKTVPTIKLRNRATTSCLPKFLNELRKKRNTLNKTMRRNPTSEKAKKDFYEAKVIYDNELQKFRSSQWQKFIDDLKPKALLSLKSFWKRINRIRSNKKSNKIPTLKVNDIFLDDDEKKAEYFANKLQNTFNNEQSYSATFNENFKTEIENWYNNYISDSSNLENTNEITYSEIKKAIKKINNKSSLDQSNISNRILKNSCPLMIKKIQSLFNNCLKNNTVPLSWKTSTITMIPKKGDKTNPKNYRPISITSCILRLYEKVILNRLWNFLDANKIIIKNQSGFRANRQTRDNLVFMCQKSLENFNYNKKVCAVFYDIASAFDKVWFDGLIHKMEKLKIPKYLILWCDQYLRNRRFQVRINDYLTRKYEISNGLPQGGVMSPVLFSIFINDIPLNDENTDEYSLLFADDLLDMFIVDMVTEETSNYINARLKTLEEWLNKWRLKMAPEKCNYQVFSKNKKTGKAETLNIKLYDKPIPKDESNDLRFLGIKFDKFMSFKNQVQHIKDLCLDRLNIIKLLCHKSWKLSPETLVNIYKLLIGSIIEYSMFLFNILSKTHKMNLQRIQNKALRAIYYSNRFDDINELHEKAKLDTIETRTAKLKDSYLKKNLTTNNPLITKMVADFEIFNNITKWRKHKTLLDDWEYLNDPLNNDVSFDDCLNESLNLSFLT